MKGQKWGVRRYQNKNGSLTALGKKRIKSASESPREVELKRRRSLSQSDTISELKKLTDPARDPNFDGSTPEQKKWLEFDQEIRKFSGDWYERRGVSRKFSDRVAKYEADIDGLSVTDKRRAELRKQYQDDLLGIVLNDLGYKDSPEARELIRDTVIWD